MSETKETYVIDGAGRLLGADEFPGDDWEQIKKTWGDPAPTEPIPAGAALALVQAEIQNYPETPTREMVERLLSATQRALAQVRTTAEAKELHDGLDAMQRWLKMRGAEMVEANLISAERLRVERKIGEMLKGTVSPGRGGNTLPDGVSGNQSYKWQRIAEIPGLDFEHWLDVQLQGEEEITTGAALGLWSRFFQPPPPPSAPGNDNQPPPPDPNDEADGDLLYACKECGAVQTLQEMKLVREDDAEG